MPRINAFLLRNSPHVGELSPKKCHPHRDAHKKALVNNQRILPASKNSDMHFRFNIKTKVQQEQTVFKCACLLWRNQMSRIVRKPDFCLCENKGADQLRGNHEADQRLCFRYTYSIFPLLLIQAVQCSLVQNIYFGLQKIGILCPKNRRKIGNYRPKMAFL